MIEKHGRTTKELCHVICILYAMLQVGAGIWMQRIIDPNLRW